MPNQNYRLKDRPHEWSFANRDGYLSLLSHGEEGRKYHTGEFYDPRGIVSVYRQSDFTELRISCGDRVYARAWERYLGDRTIARLSRAFLTDILEAEQ